METIIAINESLAKLFKFQPMLMIPVFMSVWIVSGLVDIRGRMSKSRASAVHALLNVIVSFAVVLVDGHISDNAVSMEKMINLGYHLAGGTALTYSIFISAWRSLLEAIPKIVKRWLKVDERDQG